MRNLLLAFTAITLSFGAVQAGGYPDISVADLKKAIEEKKVVVLDVNGPESFKEGHVPTAIDFASNKDKLASLLPADKETLVVAYCGSEYCSAYKMGAKAAEALGYKNVKHLAGGIAGWKKAGESLEKPL